MDLDEILSGVKPTAPAPAMRAPLGSTRVYEPVDAAIRTVYGEAPANATREERQAIAAVIANRAAKSGKTFTDVVQEGDGKQFNPWLPGTDARKRIEALTPDSPEYKAIAADVGGILSGQENPYPTLTHFYHPGGMKDGAKPKWDDGTGQQIGEGQFFSLADGAEGGSGLDALLSGGPAAAGGAVMSEADAKAAYEQAFGPSGDGPAMTARPETGIGPDGKVIFRDTGKPAGAKQSESYLTLAKARQIDPDAPEGSIKRPFMQREPEDKFPPGTYYIAADKNGGGLQRMPGGDEKSSATHGAAQGVQDVLTSGFQGLGALDKFINPNGGDSDILSGLQAGQMQYDADYKGDTKSGLGRFTGQMAGAAVPIAGAEAALLPALSNLGPVGAFLAGKAGGNILTKGASLAARGAAEGAGGAALVSSASDDPLADQIAAGAAGGAIAGPVLPAIGAAGKWAGRSVRDLVEPLTKGGQAKIADRIVSKFAGDGLMIPNADEIIPGSVPTLATATGNPGVATLERTVRLSHPQAFAERDASNAAARADFLDSARGDEGSVADLVRVRDSVVRDARGRAFANAQPVESQGIVQVLDEALAAPEAQMDSVARPLQVMRDKIVQPPAETTPAQAAAFNRAVTQTFGADADALTPEVMSQARQRLGAEFERIAANTEVKWDDALRGDIGQIIHDTAQVIPESRLPPLFKRLEDIASTADDGGNISGLSYQSLTKRGGVLDTLQKSADSDVRNAANAIRERLDDALESTMEATPEGATALDDLRNVRLQYKNLKTVEKALSSAGVDKQVSPDAVLRAVKGNFKDNAYSGGGPLGDVAEAAVREQGARPPRVETDARQIYGMRSSLEKQVDSLRKSGTDADNAAADRLEAVMDRMDDSLEQAAPGYASYRDVAQRSREPIEAQRYLQGLKLKDSKGNVTLGMVDKALDAIRNNRAKPGAHPAKSISAATIEQLEALKADLLRQESLMNGAPRGSATAQHLATGNISGNMGVPLALGATLATGNPVIGAAMGAGKLFYKMKDDEIQQALVSRLLNPEAPAVVSRPSKSSMGSAVKFLGKPLVPAGAGILSSRLLGTQ